MRHIKFQNLSFWIYRRERRAFIGALSPLRITDRSPFVPLTATITFAAPLHWQWMATGHFLRSLCVRCESRVRRIPAIHSEWGEDCIELVLSDWIVSSLMLLLMSQWVPVLQSEMGDADRCAVYKFISVKTTDDVVLDRRTISRWHRDVIRVLSAINQSEDIT